MKSNWYFEGIDGYSINKPPTIVLASSSLNRLKLLEQIGIYPIVEASNFTENLPKNLPPEEYVKETAKCKALEIVGRLQELGKSYDVIIGSDTMIEFEGLILGKPIDKNDALETLKKLSGKKHIVYTGVALVDKKQDVDMFYNKTIVEFGNIPDNILEAYVESGEAMNRAGSYAIQGFAGIFVKSISGCYHSVVGLPIYEVVKRIQFLLRK